VLEGPQRSRLTVYRAVGNSGPGRLLSIEYASDCSGAQHEVQWYAGTARSLVFSVSDMTGDGLPEIFYVQPDTGSAVYFESDNDYHEGRGVTLGDQRAVLL
jgi:hypothetical protein